MRPSLIASVLLVTFSALPGIQQANPAPGQLELDPGLIRVDANWYQDQLGLKQDKYLKLEAQRESPEVVCVRVGGVGLAGIALELRFRMSGDEVTECIASGRWHTDAGSRPEDFAGSLLGVSGIFRARIAAEGDQRTLQSLFVVRGKRKNSRELVMGGFKLPIPEPR